MLESIVSRQYNGEKLVDIAAELGYSRKGIYLAAKREGVQLKNKRQDKSVVIASILERKSEIESGRLSMRSLSRELGLTAAYITRRCKELGIISPFRGGFSDAQIEDFDKVLFYIEENGGYVPGAIRALGLNCDRHTVHKYAKSIGFDVTFYRYSNHVYGNWKILPCIPEPCYTADFKVTALCMLCNTEHRVLLTNLRGGTSKCCFNCCHQHRENSMIKCDQTGKVYRSIRRFTKDIGLISKYQAVKRRLSLDGFYEHEGLIYRPM